MVLMASKWDDEDWFRSSTWSPEIAEAFEARLKRARAWNRAQYLRVQGLHLAAQNDKALRGIGRDLFRRVVDDYGDNHPFEALTALENLGDSLAAEGADGPAESAYREVLTRVAASPTGRSGTSHTTELSLAELLLARGDNASLEEADGLLDIAEEQVRRSGDVPESRAAIPRRPSARRGSTRQSGGSDRLRPRSVVSRGRDRAGHAKAPHPRPARRSSRAPSRAPRARGRLGPTDATEALDAPLKDPQLRTRVSAIGSIRFLRMP